jgi:hypothetical protein
MRLVATAVAVGLLAALLFAGAARADSISVVLDTEFSGAFAASGSPTITFTDAGADTVTMTMDVSGLSGSEFIRRWFFNSSLNPAGFTFTHVSGDAAAISVQTTFNQNTNGAFKADGDGYFDIVFDFTGAGDLDADEPDVVYTISGNGAGISVSTFLIGSATGGGSGTWMSAAHVQGVGSSGANSGWMGGNTTINHSPEPGTIFLLSAGVAGLVGARRRARRRASA